MKESEKPYSAASLAREAGVTRAWVAELVRRGDIEAVKVGTHWIIAHEEGQRWLEAREAAAAADEEEP